MIKKNMSCGLIMPISATGNYSEEHWCTVKKILEETVNSIEEFDLSFDPVWEANHVDLIHRTMIGNIYKSDIIICDVSSMNPNVLFELGIRLAFDKPTIIIADNETKLPFDTKIIEHLFYEKDLSWVSINKLQESLKRKIVATLKELEDNKNYSPFLSSFGTFHKTSMNVETINTPDEIVNLLSDMKNDLSLLRRNNSINNALLKVDPQYIEFLIEKAINEWCRNNNVPINSNLLKNKDFFDWVETEINSSRFFDSIDEFREVVNILLMRFMESA